MRIVAAPGRRTPVGQNVSRESLTTAVPTPPSETSKRLYAARAGTLGSLGAPRVQPSAAIPVLFARRRIGPSSRTSVAFAATFSATFSPTTSTPFVAST